MLTEVKGVVVREANTGESDKLVDIYTDNGIVTAIVKGVRSISSKNMATAQLFCYGSYILYSKNGYYWVKEGSLIDNFFNIRLSIEKTALACYICEVLKYTATNEPSEEQLSLLLNCLYALSVDKYDYRQIKAVFEIRLAVILGFMPAVSACNECSTRRESYLLDIMNGSITCHECRRKRSFIGFEREDMDERGFVTPVCVLTEGARAAFEYISYCKSRDILSFTLNDEDMSNLIIAAERYIVNHLDTGFGTLDFYHEIMKK